ncbi:MAG: molecular chaperone TorD family protein [Burkholderiales bacterium]|nr:molecular chaperone TorD family protein [Burkholderiales bacterium]
MNTALLLRRSRVYGVLSLAFADPDSAMLRELRRRAAGLETCLRASGGAKGLGRALPAALRRLPLHALRAAHVRCFGYAVSKECPPYEAEYDQANLFQKTQTLADIAGFYRAFGLETAPALHERADHVSVELEFMQFLCLKEAHAAGRNEPPGRIAQCRAAQAKFLGQHLGVWAPGFARRLNAVAREGPYALLARLLEAYIAAEMARLEVRPNEGGRLNEAPDAPEDGCAAACALPMAAGPIEVIHERT